MKIPDDYSVGSQPLNEFDEQLSLGLVELSFILSEKILQGRDFTEPMEIYLERLSEQEKYRMTIELVILSLFFTTRWFMVNYKEDCLELLDRMHFHFKKSMSGNSIKFAGILTERYLAYDEALRNKIGGGPAFWFGKKACQYILGREDVDYRIVIKPPFVFADVKVFITDSVKEFFTNIQNRIRS